jgi:hypothetical protein
VSQLEPLPEVLIGMVEPQDLKRRILQAVQEGYQALTEARGPVGVREDTFDVQRRLGSAGESLKGYAEAFTAGARMVATLQEEELVEAVGEQEGVPREGITVPDAGGDLLIAPRYENEYQGDLDQLVAVVAADVMTGPNGRPVADFVRAVVEGDERTPEELEDILHSIVMGALNRLILTGKFTPQVSKVKTYAAGLSRNGRDDLAAVARTSLTKTSVYKGVTTTRKGLEP